MSDKTLSSLLKGNYDNATAYTVGDIVKSDGGSFVCIVNSTGNLPTDTNFWQKLVDKGDTGDTGDTGATGAKGDTGDTGATGADGDDAYVYIAYASDDSGTGFTTTFDSALDYIAIKSTTTEIVTPQASDFTGLWKNYKGETGATGSTGATGDTGADGDDAYVYIAYASDDSGTGFTTTFDSNLDYIAVKTTTTEIASPTASDFTGLWKNYKGTTGDTGATGSTGATGDGGVSAGILYNFDDTTTDGDPGSGNLRFNNATIASVTKLFIDNLEAGGADVSTFIDQWDDSTDPSITGTVFIMKVGTPSTFAIFNITGAVTDDTGYRDVVVTHVASSGTFTNADGISVLFSRTGNKGTDGEGTGDVSGPASSTDNAVARFDSTTGKLIQDSGVTISDSNVIGTTSGALGITPTAGSNLNINLSTTGDFAVNTDDLYVDTSTGNVGIGTTNPSAKLEVDGDIKFDGGQLEGGTLNSVIIKEDAGNYIFRGLNYSGYWTDEVADSTSFQIGGGGNPVFTGYDSNVPDRMMFNTAGFQIAPARFNEAGGWKVPTGTFEVYDLDNNLDFIITSAGNVGIGTDSPDRLLHNEVSDAGTNAVVYGQRISHITSGTAAAGFGIGTEYELEGADGTNLVAGAIELLWTDASTGAEDADMVFKVSTGGAVASEVARLTSGGVLNITGLTASEILITDASKNLVSAAVATYPSLTELTYVKGVTSAIQTQIDAKMTNPMTTGGDVIYGGASGLPTRLANGTAGQILTSGGTTVAPTWEDAGGSGAPTDATYIVQTASAGLSAEQALGALATGIVKNTTTTGVLSIATAGTDYVAPGGALGTPSSGTLTNTTGLPLTGLVSDTTTALGVGSIELGHATDTTIARVSAGVISVEGVTVPTISSTDTLTNKTLLATSNVTTESTTAASDTTANPTGGSLQNFYSLTALAAATEFQAPSGTPANGNKLIIRIKDDGTARALTYNAIYRAIGVTLPTTTVISKTMYLGCIYNSADSKWDVLAVSEEA